MAALRSLTDDSDLEQDLAQTIRDLTRLRDAHARIQPTDEQWAKTIQRQIESCERHLLIQRANVRSPWFGMAVEAALEHGDALKGGRA